MGRNVATTGKVNLPARVEETKQKAKFPASMPFYLVCHQKGPPIPNVGLPASNSLAEKMPQQLVTPEAVNLTTKIKHHRHLLMPQCVLSARENHWKMLRREKPPWKENRSQLGEPRIADKPDYKSLKCL